jgi:hypothetical protein
MLSSTAAAISAAARRLAIQHRPQAASRTTPAISAPTAINQMGVIHTTNFVMSFETSTQNNASRAKHASLSNSMANPEVAEFKRRRPPIDGGMPDILAHPHGDLVYQCVQLSRRALKDQLHSPVGQVLHESRHVARLGELPNRVPKAHSLHATAVENLASFVPR